MHVFGLGLHASGSLIALRLIFFVFIFFCVFFPAFVNLAASTVVFSEEVNL